MSAKENFQPKPELVLVNIGDIRLPERKLRRHPSSKTKKLDRSIAETGHFGPIVIDQDNQVIDGVARVEAALRLGMKQLPCIVVRGLGPSQTRALRLALNRLGEDAAWDVEQLSLELEEIRIAGGDLELSGFDDIEIDRFLTPKVTVKFDDEDVEAPHDGAPICQVGDLWACGDHKIFCGDATDADAYGQLLGSEVASLVITDSPYNLSIEKGISGRGPTKHNDFVMASGEMNDKQFDEFLHRAMSLSSERCRDGSLHYWFIDWRHVDYLVGAGRSVFSELINVCVWAKSNWGMGNFYRSQHELVAVFKKGTARPINNVQRGKHGRGRSNLWQYAGQTSFSRNRAKDLSAHPTIKPVQMIADAIQDASLPGDLVLDPFGGSGTTMLAAEMTNRRAVLLELDPKYVDLTLKRYQKATGKVPVLLPGNLPMGQIAPERQAPVLAWPSDKSQHTP